MIFSKNCVTFYWISTFSTKKSNIIISAVYRESVIALGIQGATSVIKVDGTRWISHLVQALSNLLNGLQAHKAAYATIISTPKYSKDQRKKATGFMGKQSNGKLMSFSYFMLDVLKSMSFFCKMSQKKNVGVSEIESSLK